MSTLDKINIYLRIITVILFIIIAIFSFTYDFGDCNVCEFEYEGDSLDANEFMNKYTSTCFKKTTSTNPTGDVDLTNFTELLVD